MFYLACLPYVIAVLYSLSNASFFRILLCFIWLVFHAIAVLYSLCLMPASAGYWYVLFGLSPICHNCSLFSNASFFRILVCFIWLVHHMSQLFFILCLMPASAGYWYVLFGLSPMYHSCSLFSLSNASFFGVLVCFIWLVYHMSQLFFILCLMPASSGYWYVLFGLYPMCYSCSLLSV